MGNKFKYEYKPTSKVRINLKPLIYLVVLAIILSSGYTLYNKMSTPTGQVISDQTTDVLECPPCDQTECPIVTCSDISKAKISMTLNDFKGIDRYLSFHSDVINEELISLDTDLLHTFYLGDNYGMEKIIYKNAKMQSDNYGQYLYIPSESFYIGTYLNKALDDDGAYDIYFLTEEKWLVKSAPSQLIFGDIIVNTTLRYNDNLTIGDINIKVKGVSPTQANLELDGVSGVVNKEKTKKLSDYYVYLKDTDGDYAHILIFNQSKTITAGDSINDDLKYFMTSDSFGLVNRRDIKLYINQSIKADVIDINLTLTESPTEELTLSIINDADTGNTALRLSSNKPILKTNEGNKYSVYIFGPDTSYMYADQTRTDPFEKLNNIGNDVPRTIQISNYIMTIKEPNDNIKIKFDLFNNKLTNINVEDKNGFVLVSDFEVLEYTPFGTRLHSVSTQNVVLNLVTTQRYANLKIGKVSVDTKEQELTVGQKTEFNDVTIGLKELS